MPMLFDAAIVDLDGTMVDTLGDFEAALNSLLPEMGLPPARRDLIERSVGKGSRHLLTQVLVNQMQLTGQTQTEASAQTLQNLDHALERYEFHYVAINGQHSTVYPGVPEGLGRLKAHGLRLACVTNKPMRLAAPLLEIKGLHHHFEHVFGGDSFERTKPDPLPLIKTCQVLGTEPSRTLMIGDSSNDAQAARAAGCPVVLMTYGYNHGEPIRQTPALAWLDALTDLESLVPLVAPA